MMRTARAPAWLRRRLDACRGDGGGGDPYEPAGAGSGRRGVGGGDRGMSAIEFVLLTPVLYFMIFATVQFGLYFFADHVAQAGAQAGAREARKTYESNPGGWQGRAQTKAREMVDNVGPKLLTGADIRAYESADERVGVSVEGGVVNVFPFIDLRARAESEGPIERFVPDLG